jgi:hypothetical protein
LPKGRIYVYIFFFFAAHDYAINVMFMVCACVS